MFVAVTYLLVHELVYISSQECARSCAVVIKRCPSTASARYDYTSIDRAPSTLQKIVLTRSHAKPSNLEDLSNNTRPTLSPTRATLLNIFGVVGRNDVLARLGVVHDGLGVREKSIEAPVENASGDEGVDIADVETAQVKMLAWLRPSCAQR
jgi:hypothetical protein